MLLGERQRQKTETQRETEGMRLGERQRPVTSRIGVLCSLLEPNTQHSKLNYASPQPQFLH